MKRGKPFTLVELLVVIAIISILAAMLLPALERARQSARTVSCVSNQKNMALGLIMYCDENDGHLPTHKGLSIAAGGANFQSSSWMFTLANAYKFDRNLFVCPGNSYDTSRDGSAYLAGSGNWIRGMGRDESLISGAESLTLYSLNLRLVKLNEASWGGTVYPGIDGKTGTVRWPGRAIMVLEDYYPGFQDGVYGSASDVQYHRTLTSVSLPANRPNRIRDHRGRGNVFGMVDGHVELAPYPKRSGLLFSPLTEIAGDWFFKPLW